MTDASEKLWGALVAQGLSDGTVYPESISAWDIAAVKLIVEEAGGKVSLPDGSEPRFDAEIKSGIIVSNGVIHQDLIDIVGRPR